MRWGRKQKIRIMKVKRSVNRHYNTQTRVRGESHTTRRAARLKLEERKGRRRGRTEERMHATHAIQSLNERGCCAYNTQGCAFEEKRERRGKKRG